MDKEISKDGPKLINFQKIKDLLNKTRSQRMAKTTTGSKFFEQYPALRRPDMVHYFIYNFQTQLSHCHFYLKTAKIVFENYQKLIYIFLIIT